ncbi:MAG TPA: two-component system response regulator CreB, partial [Thermodesulfovibrionales bacterium]|nr:two-component system response regulator CreB [Thermodesulfovibrionales bacterium]
SQDLAYWCFVWEAISIPRWISILNTMTIVLTLEASKYQHSNKEERMRRRILVVEDEPSISDNIVYALSTEGFDPVPCGTGREALEILRTQGINLVIVDIGLPDVDGLELAHEIRRSKATPIIFVTARSGEIDRIVGLELGADDYVVKPFSPRELVARIRAVLRRTSEMGNTSLKPVCAGNPPFRVDDVGMTIYYHERKLELTRYEFRLLRLLVTNPGRVFTREQLMDRAWEEPDMSLERTVDTHIKTLRQKLKAVFPGEPIILTHRGTGYSLKVFG